MAGKVQIQVVEGPKIVTDNLVLYLDAANPRSYTENNPSKWNDISKNAEVGTSSGLSLPIYYSSNQGILDFVRDEQQKTLINTPNQLITGGEISIAMWASWRTLGTSIADIRALVDNDHSSPGQGFILQDRPDLGRSLQFCVLNNYNGVRTVGTTPGVNNGVVGDGTWKYIVCTNDLYNDSIYVNGSFNNMSEDEGGINGIQPHITIGAIEGLISGQGFARFLNGSIGLVKIYNRALTSTEILQNYNATKWRYGL